MQDIASNSEFFERMLGLINHHRSDPDDLVFAPETPSSVTLFPVKQEKWDEFPPIISSQEPILIIDSDNETLPIEISSDSESSDSDRDLPNQSFFTPSSTSAAMTQSISRSKSPFSTPAAGDLNFSTPISGILRRGRKSTGGGSAMLKPVSTPGATNGMPSPLVSCSAPPNFLELLNGGGDDPMWVTNKRTNTNSSSSRMSVASAASSFTFGSPAKKRKEKERKMSVSPQQAANVEELRKKLHERVSQLRSKRKLNTDDGPQDSPKDSGQPEAKRQKREKPNNSGNKSKKSDWTPRGSPGNWKFSGNSPGGGGGGAGAGAGSRRFSGGGTPKYQTPQHQQKRTPSLTVPNSNSKGERFMKSPHSQRSPTFSNFVFSTETTPASTPTTIHSAAMANQSFTIGGGGGGGGSGSSQKFKKSPGHSIMKKAEALQKRLKELEGTPVNGKDRPASKGHHHHQRGGDAKGFRRGGGGPPSRRDRRRSMSRERTENKDKQGRGRGDQSRQQYKRKEQPKPRRDSQTGKDPSKKQARPGFEGRRPSHVMEG